MYSPPTSGPRVIIRLLGSPALYFVAREDPKPDIPPVPDPRRAAVAGLIITLLLVVGSVFLIHVLDRSAKLQDCVMSGRTNCAPIAAPAGSAGP